MTGGSGLSVGIASRGRPESLVRNIAALPVLGAMLDEVIVVDDGSEPALEPAVRAGLTAEQQAKLRVLRLDPGAGLAAARSRAVFEASSPYVLNLDDDAVVLSAEAIRAGVAVLDADPAVLAVAFAQGRADGTAWPAGAQPAPVDYPCRVPAFIGFAHLVRREAFVALGGFRAQLIINGEEREFCLRALDRGLHVVYLPDARVAHLADPAGRDLRRYLRTTVRNGVLASIYNDPLPLLAIRVPMRLTAYFRMRRGWQVDDPGGFRAILGWLARDARSALAQRRAVRWATIRRWRALARQPERYEVPR